MQNVPKIVLKRLQETRIAEAHPDADQLTAFAEQSLAEGERAAVTEHLARCGDCREVVAFAMPASETATVPGPARAARGTWFRGTWFRGAWLKWPVLRWSVVAAGIVLVTSAGLLQYRQRTQQNAALTSSPVQDQDKVRQEEKISTALQDQQLSAPAADAQAIVAQPPEMAKRTPMRKASRGQSTVAAGQPPPSLRAIFPAPQTMNRAGAGRGIGSGSGGGIGGGVFRPGGGEGGGMTTKPDEVRAQNDAFAMAPAAKEAQPAASQNSIAQSSPAAPSQQVAVSGSSQVVEVQTEAAEVAPNLVQGQLEKPRDLPVQGRTFGDVVKAKDLAVIQTPSGEPSALAAPPTASPRWAISSGGGLERSFDGGKTWEDVNVSQVYSAGSMQLKSIPKYGDEKNKKVDKVQSAPVVVFRAVAAINPEIWAGGSGAMLFHSIDSGIHWIRVLPAETGAALTGDITAIEFSDAQHGRIATSAGELWITADDGQTWRKQ